MTRKQFAACAAHRIYVLATNQNGYDYVVDTNFVPKVNKDLVLICGYFGSYPASAYDYLSNIHGYSFNIIKLSELTPIALLPIGKSTNVEYIRKAYFPSSVEIKK